jgi:hypothetical protein
MTYKNQMALSAIIEYSFSYTYHLLAECRTLPVEQDRNEQTPVNLTIIIFTVIKRIKVLGVVVSVAIIMFD